MGSITKVYTDKGELRHKAEVSVQQPGQSKPTRRSKRCRTRREATAWISDTETALSKGKVANRTALFGDALHRYAREVAPKKKGAKWDITRCEKIARHSIAQVPVVEMCMADAEDYMQVLEDAGLKPNSIIREMTLAKLVMRQCEKWYSVPYPWKGLKMPTPGPSRDRLITDGEIETLKAITDYKPDYTPVTVRQKVCAVFLFAIETAMRLGEIASLTPAQLDLQKSVANLPETKNGDKRSVPLSPDALGIIANLPDCAPDEPVFGVASNNCSKIFGNMRKSAGMAHSDKGGFTFHDTRHLACTRLARVPGITVLDLARITGHKNINELMTYFNAPAEEMAKRMAQHAQVKAQGGGLEAMMAMLGETPESLMSKLRLLDSGDVTSELATPSEAAAIAARMAPAA